ncbi:MAG: hypothetical protein ACKPGT_14470, partial [Microcystis sp.]
TGQDLGYGGAGGEAGFGGAGGNSGIGLTRGGAGSGGYGAPAGKTGSGTVGAFTRNGTGGFGASGTASAGMGGAIFIHRGNLEIQNSSFTDNAAKGTDGSSGFGGAIYNKNGENQPIPYSIQFQFVRDAFVNISSNTTFTNNYASSGSTGQNAIGDNINTQAVYGSTKLIANTQTSVLATELFTLSAEDSPIVIQNEPILANLVFEDSPIVIQNETTPANLVLEDSGIDYSSYN